MTTTVEAIYEQGVLRLIQPLSLAEGTRVDIIVMTREPTAWQKERELTSL
jgi:predicted DNA-binding antitoxin AbrB/MazE fold protein